MNDERLILTIYRQYIVQVGVKDNRPFKLPTNINSLKERNDESFFYVLRNKLKEKGIVKQHQVQFFMECASKILHDFSIIKIVERFAEILVMYNKTKEFTQTDKYKNIRITFEKLEKFCIINNINNFDDLLKGNPSLLLKLWKKGLVDERLIVKLINFDQLKTKPWCRVYCGGLIPKVNYIIKELRDNVDLDSYIEGELVKFKNSITSKI